MDLNKPTVAIYAVNDIDNSEHPTHVHDHSLCIYEKGEIRHYIHLERITRNKYDNSLPKEIKGILKKLGYLNPEKFDLIFVDNIIGRSFMSERGDIRFEAPLNKNLSSSHETGRSWWFDKHHEAHILNHELAHVFSCLPFFGNFKKNSLLVHFDGGASLSNFSAWHWKNNKAELIEAN
jgi:carbamoyltransferase